MGVRLVIEWETLTAQSGPQGIEIQARDAATGDLVVIPMPPAIARLLAKSLAELAAEPPPPN